MEQNIHDHSTFVENTFGGRIVNVTKCVPKVIWNIIFLNENSEFKNLMYPKKWIINFDEKFIILLLKHFLDIKFETLTPERIY